MSSGSVVPFQVLWLKLKKNHKIQIIVFFNKLLTNIWWKSLDNIYVVKGDPFRGSYFLYGKNYTKYNISLILGIEYLVLYISYEKLYQAGYLGIFWST